MSNRALDIPNASRWSDADIKVGFAVKLARTLHEYGTPTYRLEQIMDQVMRKIGLEGQFFSLPTGIFLSFGAPEEQRATLIRVEPSRVHLGKLAALDELTRRVIRGEVDAERGIACLDQIMTLPEDYGGVTIVLCYGLASGAASGLFGGGWREVGVSASIGILLGLVALLVRRSEEASRLFVPIAAIMASALAIVGARILSPVSVYIATLAGLIVLFPGLTFTIAIRDLATRNLVSGTAQLTGAALVFLELGFGVALGSQFARLFPAGHLSAPPAPLPGWTQWLALLVSPVAFAFLMKARSSDIGWIVLAGIVSFAGAREGAMLLGPELGGFVGALVLGLGSNLYGRLLDRTSMVPLVPGLLILVPGTVGFGSLSKFLESDVVSGVATAFKMALIAVALVTGLLLFQYSTPAAPNTPVVRLFTVPETFKREYPFETVLDSLTMTGVKFLGP
jgi:uncharacterized membrane protein YjjP (DUF1212 family)